MPIYLATFVLFCFTGCTSDEVVSAAESVEPTAADTPPPPANVDVPLPELPVAEAIEVQPESSSIQFIGAKISGSHDGGFDAFTGRVILKDEQVIGTQFVIDLNSTNSDHPKVTKHLKSKDFFHAEKYGSARFVSAKVTPALNPGAVTHRVEGVLDFHGKRRPLLFPASIVIGEDAITVKASFDINRKNWGVVYPGKPDDLIRDDVQIKLDLTFPSKTE